MIETFITVVAWIVAVGMLLIFLAMIYVETVESSRQYNDLPPFLRNVVVEPKYRIKPHSVAVWILAVAWIITTIIH